MTKRKTKTTKQSSIDNTKNTNKMGNYTTNDACCESKWNLVPLRLALGLMFLVAGLPKLIGLIMGESPTPGFFANVGIPLPVFSAWFVAIAEVVGGILLMLGLFTWITGLILAIIMIVATLVTSISPWNWSNLAKHLVYIAGLVAIMYGSKYFSLSKGYCCCKK